MEILNMDDIQCELDDLTTLPHLQNRHTYNTTPLQLQTHTHSVDILGFVNEPRAMANLLAQLWSNSVAAERTTGQPDHLYATDGGE